MISYYDKSYHIMIDLAYAIADYCAYDMAAI